MEESSKINSMIHSVNGFSSDVSLGSDKESKSQYIK